MGLCDEATLLIPAFQGVIPNCDPYSSSESRMINKESSYRALPVLCPPDPRPYPHFRHVWMTTGVLSAEFHSLKVIYCDLRVCRSRVVGLLMAPWPMFTITREQKWRVGFLTAVS